MKVNQFVICVLTSVHVLCTTQARAQTSQFLDEFGASCKSIAMGQAFTAVADDFSAAYYNPAGLTQVKNPNSQAGASDAEVPPELQRAVRDAVRQYVKLT